MLESEEGNAIVELAFVLPIFLFIVFAALEYSRTLERLQWSSMLSREAASITYRRCASERGALLDGCLDVQVVQKLSQRIDVFAPGTEFVVALFTYDATRNPKVRREGLFGGGTFRSNFSSSGFTATSLQQQIDDNELGSPGRALAENGILAVGACYIPMDSVVGGFLPGMRILIPEVAQSVTVM